MASNQLGNNGGRYYDFLNKPVKIDCNFIVDSANGNGLGIRNLKGAGVKNVYMYSSAPIAANPLTSSTYSAGIALIQLQNNYNRYVGGFEGIVSPTTGSTIAINSTSLTVGQPYIIASVGTASNGRVTIAPVADSSGSLASTYFTMQDAHGQTFAIYFQVNGVGTAPVLAGIKVYPCSIATNATASAITTALALVINALPSTVSGAYSFTTSGAGGSTLTVISDTSGPLPGAPQDSTVASLATGFTFANTIYHTNSYCWHAVGVPAGVTPAVGVSFVATATGVSTFGTSSGLVLASGVSGISSIEVIGDPNTSLAPIPVGGSPNVGGWLMVQFLASTNTTTTTLIPTAPAAGSVVSLTFYVEAGSIVIAGE